MEHVHKSVSMPEELRDKLDDAHKATYPFKSFNGLMVDLIRVFVNNPHEIAMKIHDLNKPKTASEVTE